MLWAVGGLAGGAIDSSSLTEKEADSVEGSVYAQLLPSCFLPVGVSGCRIGTMGVEDCVLRFCPSAEPEPILEIGDSEPSSTLVGALREGGEGEGIRKGEERGRHRWEVISSPAPTPKSLPPPPLKTHTRVLCVVTLHANGAGRLAWEGGAGNHWEGASQYGLFLPIIASTTKLFVVLKVPAERESQSTEAEQN